MHSTTWAHACFDLDFIANVLNLDTGHFLPWHASRPVFGKIICHPIQLSSLHLIKEYFLSSFNTGLAAIGFFAF
jgi:hypothetical protein